MSDWDALLASEDIALRERCKSDLLFLATEILGEAGVEAGQYERNILKTPGKFHVEIAEEVTNCGLNGGSLLVLVPRIHLKTTLITIAGNIQFILQDPNHRILIVSETPTLAKKVLWEIKWHFKKNDKLRRLFPEYAIDETDEEGTQNYFNVPCRTGPSRDYSFEAIGIGGATAGGHFDRISLTDILSDKTVPPLVTVETMQKTWHQIRAMSSLLDKTKKKAHWLIEGTVWNGGDAYCNILIDPGYKHWKKIVYSGWADKGKRLPLWPEVYSPEDLDRMLAEMGAYLFSCNIENSPMPDPAEAMFQPSYFKLYEYGENLSPGECPCCRGPLSKAITVDPAIGKKRSNDRTAMVCSGVCPMGSIVVLSTRAQRVEPGVIISDIYDMDAIEKPDWVGVEAVAYQKMLLWALHEESKKPGRHPLPMRELRSDEQKERRIAILAAYARSRGIWVRSGDHDELVSECLAMTLSGTTGRHDDLPDALAYRCQQMMRPDGPAPEPEAIPRALHGASLIKGEDALKMLEDRARWRDGSVRIP